MKLILLLVAVYSLIINQSSKRPGKELVVPVQQHALEAASKKQEVKPVKDPLAISSSIMLLMPATRTFILSMIDSKAKR